MKPRSLCIAIALLWLTVLATVAFSEHPYDSVCAVRKGASGGSGTLIATNETLGLVLTCHHVVGAGGRASAKWDSEPEAYSGPVIYSDSYTDVALFTCKKPSVPPVKIRMASKSGAPFVAAGYPGYSRDKLQWQQGDFLNLSRDTLTISVKHEKGMSGGAVFDRDGYLVGVVRAYSGNRGLSSSGDALVSFINRYRAKKAPQPTLFVEREEEFARVRFRMRRGGGNGPCPPGGCPRPFGGGGGTKPYDPDTAPEFDFPGDPAPEAAPPVEKPPVVEQPKPPKPEPPKPEPPKPVITKPDPQVILLQQQIVILQQQIAQLKEFQKSPLIYVTSSVGCADCADVTTKVEESRATGKRISVVEYSGKFNGLSAQQEAAIRMQGVPAIHDPNTGHSVVGKEDCLRFLANLK